MMMKEPHGEPSIEKLLAWQCVSQHLKNHWIKGIFIASTFDEPGIAFH